MADNVAITAGSGTSIATDEVGSDHYQLIKLAFGALNTATIVTPTVGLPVEFPELSCYHFVAAASTNAANIKASAGTLKGFSVFNASAVPVYIKFHNTAGTPTAGSGVVRTFGIQAGVNISFTLPGGGLAFATGIGITVVRGITDIDTTVTVANDAVGEIFYE